MTTRVANAGDFEAVIPMIRRLRALRAGWDPACFGLKGGGGPDTDKLYLRWVGKISEDPRSMLLVAVDGGRVIGFLSATMERDLPFYTAAEHALIRDVWVEPEYRRKGAARALIKLAMKEYKRLGVAQVRALSAAVNVDGQSVLQRCGFRPAAMTLVCDRAAKRRGRAREPAAQGSADAGAGTRTGTGSGAGTSSGAGVAPAGVSPPRGGGGGAR